MNKKKNKGKKTFNIIFLITFIAFLTLYISQASGYYDYKMHKKTELTKEQIEQFEKDVKEGNPIDVEEYLDINLKDYDNTFSKTGNNFSKYTSKYIKKVIEKVFDVFESLLE